MLDGKGKEVHDNEEDAAMGLRTQYLMQRFNRLVFVDEVGSNTSTTKDLNVGVRIVLLPKTHILRCSGLQQQWDIP